MTGSTVERLTSEVKVVPICACEYTTAKELIIEGLTQRWGNYDPSLNPDLEDFAKSYQNATVLVAKVGHLLIGCGVLVKEADTVSRIVRMSVCVHRQRTGVGRKILNALLPAAQTAGYRAVLLETTSTWHSAVAFYTSFGFIPVKVEDGDQHFHLVIC